MRRRQAMAAAALFAAALPAAGAEAAEAPTGAGLFARGAVATVHRPNQSVLADMNGDGRTDLVSAVGHPSLSATWGVSVALGRASGGFAPAAFTNGSRHLASIQVVDIDGDGALDVAGTTESEPRGAVAFPGRGDGTTEPEVALPFPALRAAAFGRFIDADRPWAVIAEEDRLAVWRPASAMDYRFETAIPRPAIERLLAADLDADGLDELVAGDGTTLVLYRALAEAAQSPTPRGVMDLAEVDVAGGSAPELLVTEFAGDTWALDAGFEEVRRESSAGDSVAAAAGDLDGDGIPEIVHAHQQAFATVMPAAGQSAILPLTHAAADLLLHDTDLDGDLDLLAVEPVANTVEVIENDGEGRFAPGPRPGIALPPFSVDLATADFNGDGKLDLAASEDDAAVLNWLEASKVLVMLGDGAGRFSQAAALPTDGSPSGMAVGDVNGDGDPDVVVSDYHQGAVSQHLGLGDGTFLPRAPMSACHLADGLAVHDLNDDGYDDAAVLCRGFLFPNFVSILLGTPAGLVRSPFLLSYSFNAESQRVRVGDLNGDGRPDLVVHVTHRLCFVEPDGCPPATQPGHAVTYFLGAGDGSFAPARYMVLGGVGTPGRINEYYDLGVVDVNRDGRDDLVLPMPNQDRLLVAHGKADGTLTPPAGIASYEFPMSVDAADLTGDGAPDLVIGHGRPSILSVMPVLPGGGLGEPGAYVAQGWPDVIVHGDLNRDGRMDLLAGRGDSVELFVQEPR